MKKVSILLIAYVLISVAVIYNAFLTNNQNTFTNVENRELLTREQYQNYLNKESFTEGVLQIKLNDLLSDQFPLKENMLNINLNFEQTKSDLVNLLANENELVKTGIYYRIGGTDYYMDFPVTLNEQEETLFNNRIWNFERISEKYGDKYKMYIYKPSESEEKSWFNSKNIFSYGDGLWDIFCASLNGKYTIQEQELNSLEEYKDLHYKTDHHWNHKGAYQGYSDIINMIRNDYDIDAPYSIRNQKDTGKKFYGSLSLKAMKTLGYDEFVTYELDCDDKLKVDVNGTGMDYGYGEAIFENPDYDGYIYEDYFGGNVKSVEITNQDKPDAPVILIFCDSFSNCMKKDLALHFSKVYFIDSRMHITREDPSNTYFSLDEFLEEHEDIDCILWLQFYTSLYFDSTCYLPIDLNY